MNCKKCGSPLMGEEKVCKICGEVVENNEVIPSTNGTLSSVQNAVNIQPNVGQTPSFQSNQSFNFVDSSSQNKTDNTVISNPPVQETPLIQDSVSTPSSLPQTEFTFVDSKNELPVQDAPIVQNEQVMNKQKETQLIVDNPSVQNTTPQVVQAQPINNQDVKPNPSTPTINQTEEANSVNAPSTPQIENMPLGEQNTPNPSPVEQVQMISPESVVLNSNEEKEKKKKPNKVVKIIFMIIEFILIIFIGIYVGNIIYKNVGKPKTAVPNTTNPTTEPTTAPTTNSTQQEENTNKTEPTTNGTTTKPVEQPTTAKVTGTAAKCTAIECIKLIKPENTVEEINNIIGLKGEVTDAKYNRYYWKITEDSGIEVAYYSGKKGNIFVKVDNKSLAQDAVSFAKFESDIKPRVSTGITYKEIVDIVGKVEGTLVEKSSYSTKYQWVNKNGESLKVTINNQTEKCTFATVVKGD